MGIKLLKEYIALCLEEAKAARVPNQLIEPDDDGIEASEDDDNDEGCHMKEYSGVGAVMGYMAPLGMSTPGMKKRERQKAAHKRASR